MCHSQSIGVTKHRLFCTRNEWIPRIKENDSQEHSENKFLISQKAVENLRWTDKYMKQNKFYIQAKKKNFAYQLQLFSELKISVPFYKWGKRTIWTFHVFRKPCFSIGWKELLTHYTNQVNNFLNTSLPLINFRRVMELFQKKTIKTEVKLAHLAKRSIAADAGWSSQVKPQATYNHWIWFKHTEVRTVCKDKVILLNLGVERNKCESYSWNAKNIENF